MRVCWSIWHKYDKMHGKLLREDLIKDLIDMNVPRELADTLLSEDSFRWEGITESGGKVFIGLDILADEEESARHLD